MYACVIQGSKWDGIRQYGISARLWSAWNHTATSFWPTAIPVCRRPLTSCKSYCLLYNARNLSRKSLKLLRPDAFLRRKICQKCVCGRGSIHPGSGYGNLQHSPNSLAGFKGPSSKRRGGQMREGEQGRGGKGAGREMGKWGAYRYFFFPHFEPWCHLDSEHVEEYPLCFFMPSLAWYESCVQGRLSFCQRV